jgi:pyruvate/2-oxoacid:ferredoxin oxidoreductase alpha subunit
MKKVMMGNHAVSYGVMLSRTDVISAYPITPQTQIVEELSEMCANGKLDAKFIKVESEHSAMAAVIGASQAGARAFTATSSQGLALMHEVLHWAAGSRLPIVLVNVNRSLGPGWNVWADQLDSLSQRDTGFMQVYCESNQDVLDWTLMSFKIAEKVRLPMMINLDAFFLSHTYEAVDLPSQEDVDKFLPKNLTHPILDVDNPAAFNGLLPPNVFMEVKYKMMQAHEEALDVIQETCDEYAAAFGRQHTLVDEYKLDDAEIALVTTGTVSGTSRVVIDQMREKGIKVGQLKLVGLRPFPEKMVREKLAHVKKIAVIDRNYSQGSTGIFAQELRAALYNSPQRAPLFGYVVGLGGRDITPATVEEVINKTVESDQPESDHIWIGVKK